MNDASDGLAGRLLSPTMTSSTVSSTMAAAVTIVAVAACGVVCAYQRAWRRLEARDENAPGGRKEGAGWDRAPETAESVSRGHEDVLGVIGNTPVMRIESLSTLTGCEIYVKCEFLNPGGSVKDRVALRIVADALASGALRRGGLCTEGTAGSTGVSLAMVCKALGVECFVAMPDDAAKEKSALVEAYGARVARVRPVSIANRGHFVNVARREAENARTERGEGGGYFADQFENLANYRAHKDGTGPEIFAQLGGKAGRVRVRVRYRWNLGGRRYGSDGEKTISQAVSRRSTRERVVQSSLPRRHVHEGGSGREKTEKPFRYGNGGRRNK